MIIKMIKYAVQILNFLIFSSFSLGSYQAFANNFLTYLVLPADSQVTFLAVGKPGFLKINGHGGQATCTAQSTKSEVQGECEVNIASFVTGIDLRDQHMKETYLEVGKYPKARLRWVVKSPLVKSEKQEFPFAGQLLLHGVEKPVDGNVTLLSADQGLSVGGEASFKISLSDFAIKIPQYLGVTVADSVEIKTQFTAKKK